MKGVKNTPNFVNVVCKRPLIEKLLPAYAKICFIYEFPIELNVMQGLVTHRPNLCYVSTAHLILCTTGEFLLKNTSVGSEPNEFCRFATHNPKCVFAGSFL